MTCFFDIENFKQFSKQSVNEGTKEKSLSCLKLLKNNFDISFNVTSYDDLDEDMQILIEEFQTGVVGDLKFKDDLVNSVETNIKDYYGSILLIEDEKLANKLKKENHILTGNIFEETETISKLFFINDSLHEEEEIGKEVNPETYLNLKGLPLSKIVIVDRYIFKGPEIGGNLGLFEFNMLKLLNSIFDGRKSKIDIIILYQINTHLLTKGHKDFDEGPDKEKIIQKIKKIVHRHCPKPNICLIGVPKGKIEDEHDRHVITDYLRIKSGDSFAYFSSTGELKSRSLFVDYYSHGRIGYQKNTKTLLAKINDFTNETIAKYSGGIYIPKDYQKENVVLF